MVKNARQALNQRADPQLSFHWSVALPFGFPQIYVQDINIPIPSIQADPHHVANKKRYDPGFVDTDQVSIVFFEDINGIALSYLNQWRNKVVDDNGYYGRPSEYKRSITATFLDPHGRTVTTFIAENCWPTTVDQISMTSSSNENVTVQASFACDYVRYQVNGSNPLVAALGGSLNLGFGGGFNFGGGLSIGGSFGVNASLGGGLNISAGISGGFSAGFGGGFSF